MDSRYLILLCLTISCFSAVSARAVNISNTWMLPEEGFPVFYRYFRDRISWYEADAVCQFHHANLVTVDSTSQYDAMRAYLKELDITDNVWIGLSKPGDKTSFVWRNYQPLSVDSYWQEAIPKGSDPLCTATDPAADFRWHALPCGGPEVASFICELPVPSWASGPHGCLLTELPSLTVLYIPEQSAIELTSDCGLDGTKRIACKGNADRDSLMRHLACGMSREDFDEKVPKTQTSDATLQEATSVGTETPTSNDPNIKTTKPWIWTSNTIDTGDEYGYPTRHRRETVDTMSPLSTKSTTDITSKLKQGKIKSSKPTATMQKLASTPQTTEEQSSASTPSSSTTVESTSQTINNSSEETSDILDTNTPSTKPKNLSPQDTDDFPGAISQGQLFSIIENSTMFDIIELNETATETNKQTNFKAETTSEATIASSVSSKTTATLSTTTTPTSKVVYTTVTYQKEPPEGSLSYVTNSWPKQSKTKTTKNKVEDKKFTKESMIKKVLVKNLNKEVELYPPINESTFVRLNRTNRKEVPPMDTEDEALNQNVDLDVDNNLTVKSTPTIRTVVSQEEPAHQVLEIKIHNTKNKNHTTFFVTTKRMNEQPKKFEQLTDERKTSEINAKPTEFVNSKAEELATTPQTEEVELKTNTNKKEIDSNIEMLNQNVTKKNNDSEMIHIGPQKMVNFDEVSSEEIMKQQYLPKPLLKNSSEEDTETLKSDQARNKTDEPFEPEPEAQPRPNRQRQLTRTQRRSFYPYFFSRVLG